MFNGYLCFSVCSCWARWPRMFGAPTLSLPLVSPRSSLTRAFLFAFDLLELDGVDMRREPIETRKATLASLLRKGKPGLRLNEHIAHSNGAAVFQHACKLGAEGIVSKRLGSRYRSGRSPTGSSSRTRRRQR